MIPASTTVDTTGLTLIISEKADAERDAVAGAWERRGGRVLRLGRFWEPPPLDPNLVRVYGNETFCLVLQQKLGLHLTSPADELLLEVPARALGRRVRSVRRGDLGSVAFPIFIKSLAPKQIRSRVYASRVEIEAECAGLDPESPLIVSEVVTFQAEARCFVLGGSVLDGAAYEGSMDLKEVAAFVRDLGSSMNFPHALVVDVGQTPSGLALVEFNSVWAAGLNGCDPERVLPAIVQASAPPA